MGSWSDRIVAEIQEKAAAIVPLAKKKAIIDMEGPTMRAMNLFLNKAAGDFYGSYSPVMYNRAMDMPSVGIFWYDAGGGTFGYDWTMSMAGSPMFGKSGDPGIIFSQSFGSGNHGGAASSNAPYSLFKSDFDDFVTGEGTDQYRALVIQYFFEMWNRGG